MVSPTSFLYRVPVCFKESVRRTNRGALGIGLIYLLQRWLDGGSDGGDADPADVDVDDPDNFGESAQFDGDLVTILDRGSRSTEHAQYTRSIRGKGSTSSAATAAAPSSLR